MRKSLGELMDELDGLPDSMEKLAVLEEAIALADEEQQTDNAYYLRQEFVYLSHVFGYAQKALVAFLWCLNEYDKHPEHYDEHEILWQYKWMMGAIGGFPQLSREKLLHMADDMHTRYERSGWSHGPVWDAMSSVMYFLGEWEDSLEYKEKSMLAEVDGLSDCPACRQQQRVQFYYDQEDFERAKKEAQLIFQGSMRCRTVPRRTFQLMMDVEFKMGNPEAARLFLKRLEAAVVLDAQHYVAWLDIVHLNAYLDPDRALMLFAKHYAMVPEQEQAFDQLQAYTVGAVLFKQWLKQRPDQPVVTIGMPSRFERYQRGGEYNVEMLHSWFETRAKSIAGQFDQRNGNRFFSRRLARKLNVAEKWMPEKDAGVE